MAGSVLAWLLAPARLLARLRADRRGGVLIVMALALVPLTFATGFGIDYARAMRLRTQFSAAADAAALAAVAPAMILQPDADAQLAAKTMFNAQAALLSGYQNPQVTVLVAGVAASTGGGGTTYLRKATVTYSVQSTNIFAGMLGVQTLTVRGSSAASAQQPPNIDFYLAMDISPSMLIPATSDGVAKVRSASGIGCAFACHEQMPRLEGIVIKNAAGLEVLLSSNYYTNGDPKRGLYYLYDRGANRLLTAAGKQMNVAGKPADATTYSIVESNDGPVTIYRTKASGSQVVDQAYWADGYWLTHNYGLLYGSPSSLVLRKDDVVSAATQLMPFAANQASQFKVTYQAQMFAFDWTRPGRTSPVNILTTLKDVSSYGSGFSAATLLPPEDWWWKNSQPTKDTFIDDQATEGSNMLAVMNASIPTPGTGAVDSTPQKILFIVTDGMLDQPTNGARYAGPLQAADLEQCQAIKRRGIKIAILYTRYLPEALVGEPWSQANVAPFLTPPPPPDPAGNAGASDQVLTALQSCSSPGVDGSPLVQTVTSSGNIATALQQLFSIAIQTARLIR